MKRWIKAVILGCFLSGNVQAQYIFDFAPIEWSSAPEIDLGEVRYETDTEISLSFTNQDTLPLVVDVVRTSCGCTAAVWEQMPVAPSEQSAVKITYHGEKKGRFRKKVMVFLSPYRKSFNFYLIGKVVAD